MRKLKSARRNRALRFIVEPITTSLPSSEVSHVIAQRAVLRTGDEFPNNILGATLTANVGITIVIHYWV